MLRGILTVGAWTMASRVLGFARDMLIAATLGAGPVADAFFVALRLPNLFRRLFGEGAVNAAFAPGFEADPAKFALAVTLSRITFPYLILICLAALVAGVLNGLDRYPAAAASYLLF